MKLSHLFIVTSLIISKSIFALTIDPSQLIKVSKDNNPNCVEYYQYNNELYCSTKVLTSGSIDLNVAQEEKQKIIFDNRIWQAAWAEKKDGITTIEYIPAGDNINNWQELITSQTITGIPNKVTALDFAQIVIKNLKESGLNPKINMITENPEQVIFEFQIQSPDNLKQDELQKIIKNKNDFYVLHYVIKKEDMGETERAKWLKNITESHI